MARKGRGIAPIKSSPELGLLPSGAIAVNSGRNDLWTVAGALPKHTHANQPLDPTMPSTWPLLTCTLPQCTMRSSRCVKRGGSTPEACCLLTDRGCLARRRSGTTHCKWAFLVYPPERLQFAGRRRSTFVEKCVSNPCKRPSRTWK